MQVAPIAILSLLLAAALGGILVLATGKPPPAGPPRDGAPAAAPSAPTATARPPSLVRVADDGPSAPRPDPSLTPAGPAPDPTALRPEARERLGREMQALLVEVDGHLKSGSWDNLRAVTASLRTDPALLVGLLSGEARGARGALAAGLVTEELLEDGTLAGEPRGRLARSLVDGLAAGLSGGAYSEEERAHALRILSRLDGSPGAEEALLRLVEDPQTPLAERRQAILALGQVATGLAWPALRSLVQAGPDTETQRVAALALHRTARRLGDAERAEEAARLVRPGLLSWMARAAVAGDRELFSTLVDTLAEVADRPPSALLATDLLGAARGGQGLPRQAASMALDELLERRAVDQLPALEAWLRRPAGDPELDARVREVVDALRLLGG